MTIVRAVAWRMGRAVSTLLKQAHLELGNEVFGREPVDLGELGAESERSLATVRRTLSRYRRRAIEVACSLRLASRRRRAGMQCVRATG
ncbi:MAG: hypothetical protein ACI835_002339 [Planctomycetota bacterium]|jgi:hypothetical protein